MLKKSIAKNYGFTLVELVIVIILTGIIAAVASKIVAQGLTNYLTSKDLIAANWQAQTALENMTQEIRNIRSSNDISVATATQFSFIDNSGRAISYTVSGTNLLENSQILARGIQNFSFTYYAANYAVTTTPSAIGVVNISFNSTHNNISTPYQIYLFPRNMSV
jgi:prepilin-type N-terminal cleavage/methylation domain-containing protein